MTTLAVTIIPVSTYIVVSRNPGGPESESRGPSVACRRVRVRGAVGGVVKKRFSQNRGTLPRCKLAR